MLLNIRVRTKLVALALAPVAAVLAIAALAVNLLPQIMVNGPEYRRIAASRDFAAQVSPNSLSILEIHAQVQQLTHTPEGSQNRRGVRARIEQLRQRYEAGYTQWQSGVTDPKINAYLVSSHSAAADYFELYRRQLLPALDAGRGADVTRLLDGPMAAVFQEHQAALTSARAAAVASIGAQEAAVDATVRREGLFLLVGAVILVLGSIVLALLSALSIDRRIRRLRAIASVDLPALVGQAQRVAAGRQLPAIMPTIVTGGDELAGAATELDAVVRAAVDLTATQSRLRASTVELFLNLGRRNHRLLSRTLSYISDLERDERDPEILQKLFALDHLLTRMRRHAESMLVLAGSGSLRTWSQPVPIAEVLRAALSEIESYDRVDVSSLHPVEVSGAAVADLAHLLAELLENATTFSQPETRVRVMGRPGADAESAGGYTLMAADDGWGMSRQTLVEANAYLAAAADPQVSVDSRMLGLGVVGRLAARHRIRVSLAEQPAGGVVAWVVLPASLVAASRADDPAAEAAVTARALSASRTDRPGPRRGGSGALSRPFVVEPPDGGEHDDPLLPSFPPATPTPSLPVQAEPVQVPALESALEPAMEPAVEPAPQPFPEPVAEGPQDSSVLADTGYQPEPDEPFAFGRVPDPPPDDPLAPAYPPAPRRPAYQPLSAEDYPQTYDPRTVPRPEPSRPAPSWEHPDATSPGDRLMRRVRGAQLPDTGPRTEARPRPPAGVVPSAQPARNAESVREALARYSAGRRDAEGSSE
jgi:signal transduction histidine kinase